MTGSTGPQSGALASLDLKQCFDSLLFERLHELAQLASVPPQALAVFGFYGSLQRVVWTATGPSRWTVTLGNTSYGTPQGYPLAPLWCNLCMAIWERVLAHDPFCTGTSFLLLG